MSLDPSNSDRLEETLESTRRGIRKLEIDAYRLRNDLTRLEAVLEDGIANGDVEARGQHDHDHAHPAQHQRHHTDDFTPPVDTTVTEFGEPWAPQSILADGLSEPAAAPPHLAVELASDIEAADAELSSATVFSAQPRRKYRYTTPPMLASLSLHGALVLMIVSITVATIVHEDTSFTTTFVDLGEKPPEPVKLESFDLGQIAQLDETNLQDTSANIQKLDFASPIVSEVTPVDFESVSGPASIGDLGTAAVTPIPSDAGTLQAGNGGVGPDGTGPPNGTGNGTTKRGGPPRNAGPKGSAAFFGTQSKGNRFVFVVDNSSSMKNGRLEFALAELVKTIESLSTKQSFYVIFVSDQTYPMFFPQPELDMVPATPLNKKRLVEWLPKAMLASGKNREMIKAMDMAAALNPHAVYLLWDGDMRYSDTVRLDVMTHLTDPTLNWNLVLAS